MSRTTESKTIYRIIDANLNRAKEGLRVCEEVVRFILNSRSLTSAFKTLRHTIDDVGKKLPQTHILIGERQSGKDVGRKIHSKGELKRQQLSDIFFANIQRVKESIRVLEEFSKFEDVDIALEFKDIRYRLYELEKKVVKRLASLCNIR